MSAPGFPPNTLDDEGGPVWIRALASADPNHSLHVVRGLEPAEALETLGAQPRLFQQCELPTTRPNDRTSLPAAAIRAEPGGSATLLAGQVGEWTFVYDDLGFTSHEETTLLSVHRRTAATSRSSVDTVATLTYAVDGNQFAWIDVDDFDLDVDLPGLPAELRAAFQIAGNVENDYLDPGQPDHYICMRAICALAGLYCTVDDLRQIPLLVTPFG
jgi:Family of unknown function (DUF6461)